MLGTSPLIGFVATAQPERAKTFYRDVLGISLFGDEEFALVFDANGPVLRVAKVSELIPENRTVIGRSRTSRLLFAIWLLGACSLSGAHALEEFGGAGL